MPLSRILPSSPNSSTLPLRPDAEGVGENNNKMANTLKAPQVVKIFSENAQFQIFDALKRNREKRSKLQSFIVEGVRNINNAVKYGWNIQSFIYSSEHGLSKWATTVLRESQAQTHFDPPMKLLTKLSSKEETSELLAVVEMKKDDIHTIPLSGRLLVVVFDRPSSPGNLGTLIRSCDAMGVHGLIVTGHAVDMYSPETINATTGSFFALPIIRLASHENLIPWIKEVKKRFSNLQIVGTDEQGEHSIDSHDFTKPTILLVGNETWGLSAAYKALSDAMVNIPMQGSASSLNVACTASIVLYEVNRQRMPG